jgi:diacylglycerol O-acyltransferase / wax synthase
MSYNGQVNFGLIGDYDAMADLDSFALDLEAATAEAIETAPPAQGKIRPVSRNGVSSVR